MTLKRPLRTSGPVGDGWVEEVKTSKGSRFVAYWQVYVEDASRPDGRRRKRNGPFELGPKVKLGPEGTLKSLKDARKKWMAICDSVIGRTPTQHPLEMREKTFEWFARNVYQPRRKERWRPRTAEAFEYYMGKLLPTFGSQQIGEITEQQMQRFLNELAPRSSRTIVEHCRMYLGSIFGMAFVRGVVRTNEAADLAIPETRRVFRPFLSLDDYAKLIPQLTSQRDILMGRLLYMCALRRRELFGLKVGDFDGKTIGVERQVSERDGLREAPVKTAASNARVALPTDRVKPFNDVTQTGLGWAK
ncbi:MAG: hypothetical protein WA830_11930 [Candidatus Sulfotelmatobacter sp.]